MPIRKENFNLNLGTVKQVLSKNNRMSSQKRSDSILEFTVSI